MIETIWNWTENHPGDTAAIIVAASTLILAGATFWMGRQVARQTKAAHRAAEASIETTKNDYFHRMLADAQGPPGPARMSATWALITIAEEWGEGRYRTKVLETFRKMATTEDVDYSEEERDKLLPVRGILDHWNRFGVDYNLQPPGCSVEPPRENPRLGSILWGAFRWWKQNRREDVPTVVTAIMREQVDHTARGLRGIDRVGRETGHRWYTHEWGDLGNDELSGSSIDWNSAPRRIKSLLK